MKIKRNLQDREVSPKGLFSWAKILPIVALGFSIFTLAITFQPSSEPFSAKEHHLVLNKENRLNPRSLMLTVDESLPGIKSTRDQDTTLEIPFFYKDTFSYYSNLSPFLGR